MNLPFDPQNLAFAFVLGVVIGVFIRSLVYWLALFFLLGGLFAQVGHALGWFKTQWLDLTPIIQRIGELRWEQLPAITKVLLVGTPWTVALFLGMVFGYLVLRR